MGFWDMTRRSFLRMSGVLGFGAVLSPAAASAEIAFGNVQEKDGRYKLSQTRFTMGTFVQFTLYDSSLDRAQQAVGRAVEEMHRLCEIFDRHKDGTELSHLNSAGVLRGASPELGALAQEAGRIYGQTGGAFDASVLPVVSYLSSHAAPSGRMHVDRKELAEALSLVDGSAVQIKGRDIQFAKSGMALTFDGIGKGYIVDRAADVLQREGVESFMINAGGDIRVEGDHVWHIAVEDPHGQGKFPAELALKSGAIATSGGYEQAYDETGKIHHVVNPSSGLSPVQALSVSVCAPTVMEADALATASFVMGPKRGTNFVNSLAGREGFTLTGEDVPVQTSGWSGKTFRS